MQTVLIVIQLIVSVALVIVVLLQRSEGGALGIGGGGGGGLGGLFSPRGAADTLTRTTAILAVLFFLTSMGLTLTAMRGRPESTSILTQAPAGQSQPVAPKSKAPAAPKPDAPAVPTPQ